MDYSKIDRVKINIRTEKQASVLKEKDICTTK